VLPSGLRALQVEIRAESDLEGVLTFLQALERGERLVRVERLSITRPESDVEEEEGAAEALRLTATVRGFALAPEPSRPTAPAAVMTGARR
jgi:hypothetical protein